MKPNLTEVLRAVAFVTGVQTEEITSECRQRHLVRARCIVVHIAVDYLGLSAMTAGRRLGGRNHTTAIDARNKARALCGTDPDFTRDVKEALSILGLKPAMGTAPA